MDSIDPQVAEALAAAKEKGTLQYKCPRCGEGYLVAIVRNGNTSWTCANQPKCRTTVADVDGKPVVFK